MQYACYENGKWCNDSGNEGSTDNKCYNFLQGKIPTHYHRVNHGGHGDMGEATC